MTTIEVDDVAIAVEAAPDVVIGVATLEVTVEVGDDVVQVAVVDTEVALTVGAPEVALEVTETAVVIEVLGAGIPGPPGPPGTGSGDLVSFVRTAGETLSGHRVVAPRPDGTVEYASNDVLGDATRALWLTLGAAIAGAPVNVVALGEVTEPSWTWTPGLPIFLGADGVLTQVPPSAPDAAFIVQVAATTAVPTALFFDPRNPIALGA